MKRFTDFVGQGLTGGAGFNNDDFFQVIGQIYEVLEGLAQGLSERISKETSGVISGCEITGPGPYDISAGVVYLNTASGPEIRILPAQTGVTAGTKYIIPDSDLNETRLYGDGIQKNFFITKRATLGANETGAIEFDPALNNLPFVGSQPQIPWTNIPLNNGWTGTLEYRVASNGDIHLRSRNLGKGTASLLVNVFPSSILPGANLHYMPIKYTENTDGVSAGFLVIDNDLGPNPLLNWIGTQGHFFSNVASVNDFYAVYRTI